MQEHQGSLREFAGLPYVMLHSFAHLLITGVSLECGYPASSIRERIYALPSIGYGLLLYTETTDAEGTLGGLIQVGRRIHEHVRNALEMSELCSNAPVCSQHDPQNPHEHRFLHSATCHGRHVGGQRDRQSIFESVPTSTMAGGAATTESVFRSPIA